MDVIARAIAYVEKCPPAISGSNGSTQTFTVANALVRKFALDREAALYVLEQHYNPMCQPPWTRRELLHKVDSALRKGRGEIGAYVRDGHTFNHRLPANDIDEENALPIIKFDAFARWLADACPLEKNRGAVAFLSERRVLIQAQIAGFFALPESFDEQGQLVNDAFTQFGEQTMLRTGMVKVDKGRRRFTCPRNTLCIPWRRPIDGAIQTIQRRFIGNGEPRVKYATAAGRAPRYPFGVDRLQALRHTLRDTGQKPRVAIAEGALDALAIQAISKHPNTVALAIPGVDGWLDSWVRYTTGAEEILLALDNDNAGRQCAEKIRIALSKSNQDAPTKTICPPSGKDWGEYLVKHYGR